VKTISLKKVSAVAVASLGFGLLSVVPVNAAGGTTIANTLTTLSHAGTAATPLIQGTAFTSNLTATLGTAAMADTEVCNVAFVITDPTGTEVKSATFTKAAANIGTNGVVLNQVPQLASQMAKPLLFLLPVAQWLQLLT